MAERARSENAFEPSFRAYSSRATLVRTDEQPCPLN